MLLLSVFLSSAITIFGWADRQVPIQRPFLAVVEEKTSMICRATSTKGIFVLHFSGYINRQFPRVDFSPLFRRKSFPTARSEVSGSSWPHRDCTWYPFFNREGIRGTFIYPHSRPTVELVGWRLSTVLNPDNSFDIVVYCKPMDLSIINEYISSKFTLGMFLARSPKQNRSEEHTSELQ